MRSPAEMPTGECMTTLQASELGLLVEVGFWALDERQFDDAEAIFSRLAEVQNQNPYPRIGLAMLAYSNGAKDEAIERLRAVLVDHPEAVFTRSLLARFLKENALPGWETYAREALARVQEGVAADMARGLLRDAGLDTAEAPATNPGPLMSRRV
jgi:Bacterial type III secretion protein (HrpB1_HrpK)